MATAYGRLTSWLLMGQPRVPVSAGRVILIVLGSIGVLLGLPCWQAEASCSGRPHAAR